MNNFKDSFITQANAKHNNKFSYEFTKYRNMRTHVKIKCPIHGIFMQSPASHLNSTGCPKCGYESRSEKKTIPTNNKMFSINSLNIKFPTIPTIETEMKCWKENCARINNYYRIAAYTNISQEIDTIAEQVINNNLKDPLVKFIAELISNIDIHTDDHLFHIVRTLIIEGRIILQHIDTGTEIITLALENQNIIFADNEAYEIFNEKSYAKINYKTSTISLGMFGPNGTNDFRSLMEQVIIKPQIPTCWGNAK